MTTEDKSGLRENDETLMGEGTSYALQNKKIHEISDLTGMQQGAGLDSNKAYRYVIKGLFIHGEGQKK